jgi:hypothetical protein
MSSPFSRTMRSLYADSFRPALIGLIIAIILLLVWGSWFFFAQLTFYENSQSAYLSDGEIILAEFPAKAFNRLQTGQSARLYIDGVMGKQVGQIRAIVTDVIQPSQTEQIGKVRLFAFPDSDSPVRFHEKLTGKVQIAVEQISPAQLVMRVSGLF